MPRIFAPFLICFLLVAGGVGRAAGATLKVMTFNIKGAAVEIGFDQHQSWDYIFGNSNDRRDRVVSVISSSLPDILGVQEMRLGQLQYMSNRMPDYAYYGVGRNTGTNSDSAERAGIFYKQSRFMRFGQGEFWLSETPTVPGTTFYGNGGDTNSPRMATWVKLRDLETEQSYFVINTHWSLDSEARRLSGQLMRERILELADGLPVIVTGDLNETAGSGRGYAALARRRTAAEFELHHSYAQSGAPLGKTFHNWSGGVDGLPIDFVLHSTGHFTALSGSIIRTTFGGYYPSDHYPLEVTLNVLIPTPGDYDGNGSVGVEDYDLWRASFGSTSLLAADGNKDGRVDAADYVIWRANLGNSGVSPALQAVVPEPLTLSLLGLAAASGAIFVGRRHQRAS